MNAGTVSVEGPRPTPVRIGVMDSRRPAEVVLLQAHHLRWSQRMRRGLWRFVWIGTVCLFVSNFMMLVVPLPHLHLCTLPLSLIAGPLAGWLAYRSRVVFVDASLPCPRCRREVPIPQKLEGWPARFNCPQCAIMVELGEATTQA